MASQFDDLPARVRAAAEYRLEEAGCFVRYLDHPHEWAARMRRMGRLAQPQFRSVFLDQQASRAAMIFEAGAHGQPDVLLGTICWRVFDTVDFISELESGRLVYSEPDKHGWATLLTGLSNRLILDGRICSRGGIHSFRAGSAMSWWLTTFPMAASLEDGCSYNVGIPFEPIAKSGLPMRFYGYNHQEATRPLRIPYAMSEPAPIYIAWSSRSEVRQILLNRLETLETACDQDLGAIARSSERHHEAQPAAIG